jgi:hypothetical protein
LSVVQQGYQDALISQAKYPLEDIMRLHALSRYKWNEYLYKLSLSSQETLKNGILTSTQDLEVEVT